MGITTTLNSGNDDETAVFAEAYSGDLSSVLRFDLDASQPLRTTSRIIDAFTRLKLTARKRGFQTEHPCAKQYTI